MKMNPQPKIETPDIPVMLNANEVAHTLRISRSNAYALMHTEGFPTLYIGRRMLVSQAKLIEWINRHTNP